MADEPEIQQTFKEKLLFYITAFFILLGTFSLFAFLFLVPFVIDPAFTTIFMQFDTTPAICVTVEVRHLKGVSNCSWTSCKEGCTKELFECTQIYVNYKLGNQNASNDTTGAITPALNTLDLDVQKQQKQQQLDGGSSVILPSHKSKSSSSSSVLSSYIAYSSNNPQYSKLSRLPSSNNREDYDYIDDGSIDNGVMSALTAADTMNIKDQSILYIDDQMQGLAPNDSEWHFIKAQLYPNVKGCGYPPMLNCTIWHKAYTKIGSNYSCFYSQVDPKIVISHLDLHQNTLNLVYAMAIPIPSFIISVIYLTFAYFKIYNEDEETQPLDKNAEGIDGGAEDDEDDEHGGGAANGDINKGSDDSNLVYGSHDLNINLNCNTSEIAALPNGSTIMPSSGPITPNSDLASFGHQLKVKMVDEMSRDSIDGGLLSNSGSVQGNLSKTMTTSISTPPGPIAAV